MFTHRLKIIAAFKGLGTDKGGVVSFEYVVLAACIIAVVGSVFNNGAGGVIKNTLTTALNTIVSALNAAVGG
ncbi:hypothetical protein [Bradyrhizobium sp. CCBAU 53338]|uniref:hypothetical protein n=1 Tax=Bradyrhizobium sp. CCBAU 53338 TaxID=1325111 RepID=UPI00188B765A|nr:hypothetical protein [Bradyrhizobium sp. CCBAU 53338]QOZ52204.1 hypothetical protein XH90_13100 [Bradyrhizobium sp. CCBAU 53338]